MASAAGKVGGVTWHHLFLVAADAAGRQTYLRAGPQCLPLRMLIAGRASRERRSRTTRRRGRALRRDHVLERRLRAGGVDFDPAAANVPLASGAPAAQLWEKLRAEAAGAAAEQVPYDPVGRGANWALMEAMRRCGVKATLPPKRWAPGRASGPLRTRPPRRRAASAKRRWSPR
jgi:hypothetical protein